MTKITRSHNTLLYPFTLFEVEAQTDKYGTVFLHFDVMLPDNNMESLPVDFEENMGCKTFSKPMGTKSDDFSEDMLEEQVYLDRQTKIEILEKAVALWNRNTKWDQNWKEC